MVTKTSTEVVANSANNALSREVKRPMGVYVAIALLMLGALGNLLLIIPEIPAYLFGKLIYGVLGAFIGLIFGGMGIALGYGFYKLKKIAWTVGMPWLMFEAINGFFSLFIITPIALSLLALIALGSLVTSIPVILYINFKKDYFIC